MYRFVVRGPIAPCTGLGSPHGHALLTGLTTLTAPPTTTPKGSPAMNAKGAPTRAGEVRRQTGAVATAVKTDQGLRWEVRREGDGLVRVTTRLAHTSHWHRS